MTRPPIDLDALRSNWQRVRDLIASLTAAGAGEEVLEPLRRSETQLQQQIDTGGVAVAAQKLLPLAQQALAWARPLFG